MFPWNNCSKEKNLLAEVNKTNNTDELKKVVKTLIDENSILCQKTNTALKTIKSQKILIKYLKDTFSLMMSKGKEQAEELLTVLASETLRTLDSLMRYHILINNLTKEINLETVNRKQMKQLCDAIMYVPLNAIKGARARCLCFLSGVKGNPEAKRQFDAQEKYDPTRYIDTYLDSDDEQNIEAQDIAQMENIRRIRLRNSRIDSFKRNRKQSYRIMAKRNACKTSRKYSVNKSRNRKFRRNKKKSAETSKNNTKGFQSMKISRRRRLKRKAEMIDESPLESDNENSGSVNKISVIQTETSKKIKSNDSVSNPTNESYETKDLEIRLIDFMTDLSVDNDPYIAQFKKAYNSKGDECSSKINDPCIDQFKQTYNSKGNECSSKINEEEFQIVDDVDDDPDNEVDDDQKIESDLDNNDEDENQDDDNSFKSPESEDDNTEEETSVTPSTSQAASSEERTLPTNFTSENERKGGPRTPPLLSPRSPSPTLDPAPLPAPVDYCRKGPRTPSLSPPVPRRGPRTPPGPTPSSDSEDVMFHNLHSPRFATAVYVLSSSFCTEEVA